MALGRDMAGVHWRSDAGQALLLGKEVTISILRDQRRTYNNPSTALRSQSSTDLPSRFELALVHEKNSRLAGPGPAAPAATNGGLTVVAVFTKEA